MAQVSSQKYVLVEGLDQSTADGSKAAYAKPYGLLQLINAYINRRRGAVIKRGGSENESISGSLNNPLGMGVYKKGTESSLMPIETIYLANFAGSTWRKKETGAWAALSLNANTSFSVTRQTQFDQLGGVMGIAGGKPARWSSGASEIEMMGYPPPNTAITFVTAAGALSPIYGYTWIFTYYNSTTGKESDWSPISAASGAQTSKQFTLTLPTGSPGSTADKKRIYRTTDGGTAYRFVADIAIATATYGDNNLDTALGAQVADQFTKAVPPSSSFIIKNFKSRFWLNDASMPYQMAFSQPYIGNDNDPEYFPSTNRLNFSHEVTGAWVSSAGMYVFGVRNISLLSGYDITTFQIEPFRQQGVGTMFANSVCGNGDVIIFLSEDGYKAIIGGRVEHISYEIDEELRTLLNASYNYHIYVSSTWNPALGQFLVSISASADSGTPWVLSASGIPATWKLSATGVETPWEIIGGTSAENANTRVKVWGWSPKDGQWTEYQFAQCTDNNDNQDSINFLVTPPPSSLTFDPQQEVTYMGIDGGTNSAFILGAWRSDRSKDGASNIRAKVITDKVQPGRQDSKYKRFRHLVMEGSYLDITASGGTIKYIKDFHDPQLRDYSTMLKTFSGNGDKKVFSEGRGRFFHLEVIDETENANNILLQNFNVYFVEKELKEGR